MLPSPASSDDALVDGPGPLRLVRLRLTLALVAMAFLPIAVATPLVASALDGQRAADRLRVERDSANLATDVAARLDKIDTALTDAAAGSVAAAAIDGAKVPLAAARDTIAALSAGPDDAIVSATLLDDRGREVLRGEAGRPVRTVPTAVVDPLVGMALQATDDRVLFAADPSVPEGAGLIGLAVPVTATDGTGTVGLVRVELSLNRLLGGETGEMGSGAVADLVDGSGARLASVLATAPASGRLPGPGATTPPDGAVPSGARPAADRAITGSTQIPGSSGWTVRVTMPAESVSIPPPLLIALILAIVGIVVLVAWMARQILRPAEALETSRARLRDLYEMARVDALRDVITGLGNHRAFQEEFDRQLATARTHQTSIALVLLDLDDFKLVNDAGGHAAGDEALSAFGRIVESTVRPAGRAFRTGGDEFAILLPGADPVHAESIVRRLLSAALDRAGSRTPGQAISFSAGVTGFPQLASDRRQLIGQADAALAWAKHHGRTLIEVYDPDRHEEIRAAASVAELATAVANTANQRLLRPVYQPIVDLRGGRVIGFEGLVRPLPASGFADAGSLFAAAEAAGRTIELDAACLSVVCAGAHGLGPEASLAVNLSPRTLESDEFNPGALVALVRHAGLDPSRIVLELTEHEQAADLDRLRLNVAACRAAGFRIAADDVGAGNAGLRLLSQIQFDIVKIDLSLIQDGVLHDASLSVVGALQDLARRWGASVVAEGIETPEQLRVVRELEISSGQGYLLGRPVPADNLEALTNAQVDLDGLLERDDWLHRMARAGAGFAPSPSVR